MQTLPSNQRNISFATDKDGRLTESKSTETLQKLPFHHRAPHRNITSRETLTEVYQSQLVKLVHWCCQLGC